MADQNYQDKERSLELLQKEINGRDSLRPEVSPAVIKRLPRYFRYLRELIRMGKTRVSSAELSKMMNVTASQIRQDLNCFGGFGQQGYGYNIKYLYGKISELLGVNEGYTAVIAGAGNLGRALAATRMFGRRGVSRLAMFDIDENLVNTQIYGIHVYHIDELYDLIVNNEAFVELNRTQAVVNELMNSVNQTIMTQITGEEPSGCTHNCSTCSGCH